MKLFHSKALFTCLCIGVYAFAILSPIDSRRLWTHHANKVPRYLIFFQGCRVDLEGLVLWNFGALQVSEGTFDYCKVFFVFLFFLLKCIFNARRCALNFLGIERLS